MKIAVMQPYIFPYIGYFQLINAVDKFVLFDDVNYINKGWINRNYFLINGKQNLLTIPLYKSSQNKLIKDIKVSENSGWRNKFLKTIETGYQKAPHFKKIFEIVSEAVNKINASVSEMALISFIEIANYLKIQTKFIESSSVYENSNLKGQHRIIDICLKENANHYINAAGGKNIYSAELFQKENIKLSFIKSNEIKYKQFENEFVNNLSIIDVLMFNPKEKVIDYLNDYELAS